MKKLILKLTAEELRALLHLVRDAANEPADVDAAALTSLCAKVETAAE